jgi:hypothetical protein
VPVFTGDKDKALTFLSQVQGVFRINPTHFTTESKKINYAAQCLEGLRVTNWSDTHFSEPNNPILESYAAWQAAFKKSWGIYKGPDELLDELVHLGQTSTVSEYITSFNSAAQSLAMTSQGLPQSALISRFSKGLKFSLKKDMERARVLQLGDTQWPTLAKVQEIATLLEAVTQPTSVHVNALQVPIPSYNQQSATEIDYSAIKKVRKLSEEEMKGWADQAEKKGGCRYCKKLGHKMPECETFKEKKGYYWGKESNKALKD